MAKKAKAAAKKTSRKSDPVVHFEFPMENGKRISDFYSKAFGWNTIQLGDENGQYILAHTGETSKTGMLKKKGIINGGFFPKDNSKPAQYPSVVIAVDSIKRTMQKITKAGGKVLGEPMDIPGYGKYVSFYDTEGNRVAVMEPTKEWKAKTK